MKVNSFKDGKLRAVTAALMFGSIVATAASTQAGNVKSDDAGKQLTQRIDRVENGFAPISLGKNELPLRLNLQKLMELYKVPGLSVAVIDNFKIALAKGYGVTEAGTTTPVTTSTLFQAGSISKPVAATGALYLVEHKKLSLDEDVNLKLTSWKVPENEFTTNQKVTLRRLLSHSAGLSVHGFPGYDEDDHIPSLVQILNGEKPANTPPVRVNFVPGTKSRYSGGGVTIEQQLIIDATGKHFPQFMRETVLDKIGMGDSGYEQPLSPTRAALAASGTDMNGRVVHGKWHVYPEMAAAGLWTTPSDIAKFAIEIALSKQGKSNRVLSEAMTREMLTSQVERVEENRFGDEDHPDRMGLGLFLGDETHPDLFGHLGDDEGFQAIFVMFGDSGQGVAIMTNSNNGMLVADCLLQNIAKEFGWSYTPPSLRCGADTLLLALAQMRSAQTAVQKYWELKRAPSPQYRIDESTLLRLGYALFFDNKLQDALGIMKLQVQEYPKYWNSYDSLGDLYMAARDNQRAIQNYEKAVELNPDDQNGITMLDKLRAKK
jgi:CubicO group peptidase (beta-lactamase class C family)